MFSSFGDMFVAGRVIYRTRMIQLEATPNRASLFVVVYRDVIYGDNVALRVKAYFFLFVACLSRSRCIVSGGNRERGHAERVFLRFYTIESSLWHCCCTKVVNIQVGVD